MMIGAAPSEFTVRAKNQQNNQEIGRLPNWQSRLGAGTTGGGVNLNSAGSMNSNSSLGNPGQSGIANLPMVIKALFANRPS